ncbi:hypothetical protein [Acetobacter conturbans]|uniref:Uncharacterized protein n=1 Tax=Acetobacter conturbans TaxID=1737472 RepID=A0ABX0JY34_9PROT|nr:hypothetical protein [Acetobacter conturbans]NHN88223.1 hypothetical protein [Acetobacter conturbans]
MILTMPSHSSREIGFDGSHPVFIVATLEEGRQALLTTFKKDVPETILLSPPGAACFMGVPWWMEMMRQLRAGLKEPARFTDILDCGSQAGRAVSALSRGQTHIVFDPASPQISAVIALARSTGATVLRERPASCEQALLAERRVPANKQFQTTHTKTGETE